MNAPQPITIIGGGLAGLALGIGLRHDNVPVTIWEAGSYPRHKVCGEFISGRGQAVLRRLGLEQSLMAAGAEWARTAGFYVRGAPALRPRLPEPALCLSRFILDRVLAEEFTRAGGELRARQRWKGNFDASGVVRANGHRNEPVVDGWRWFGLKAHAQRVELEADLELHLFDHGYVGLCRLREAVNVCGLFRSRQPAPDLRQHWREWLMGPKDSALRTRLQDAEFDEESFRAVAGLCLQPRRADPQTELALGDALTMIPPATGNGMSMALEAAELARAPLGRYSRGESSWEEARQFVANAADRCFADRLQFASRLQRMLFQPAGCRALFVGAKVFPSAVPWLFEQTR
jgi:menaquinone-9 beta-reductase